MTNDITKDYIISRVADIEFILREMLTICVVKFDNKFIEVGYSVCANPANYDEDTGKVAAYNDAINKSFALFNFHKKEDYMNNA